MSLITFAYGVNILVVLLSLVGLAFGRVQRSAGMTGVLCGSVCIAVLMGMPWVLAP